jgi:predicted nucleic acid-binding protein
MSAAENLSLDTNVLVYAHDTNEPVKGPKARTLLSQILAAGRPLLSVQVLSEFFWTLTRKIGLGRDEVADEVKRLQVAARVTPVTWEILEKALRLSEVHNLPLWDAQILAAAILNGATFLLSEDFQHRRTVEGVTILNPFASDFDISEILPP